MKKLQLANKSHTAHWDWVTRMKVKTLDHKYKTFSYLDFLSLVYAA